MNSRRCFQVAKLYFIQVHIIMWSLGANTVVTFFTSGVLMGFPKSISLFSLVIPQAYFGQKRYSLSFFFFFPQLHKAGLGEVSTALQNGLHLPLWLSSELVKWNLLSRFGKVFIHCCYFFKVIIWNWGLSWLKYGLKSIRFFLVDIVEVFMFSIDIYRLLTSGLYSYWDWKVWIFLAIKNMYSIGRRGGRKLTVSSYQVPGNAMFFRFF